MKTADKIAINLKWLPAYLAQKRPSADELRKQRHLIIAVADHFEPCYTGISESFKSVKEQVELVRSWAARYPDSANDWRDADGHPFKHTYFYPAEHNHPEVISLLAEHCRQGWGEIEVHLHHGITQPDTAANTRETIEAFCRELVTHGSLSRTETDATPRYGFVHGNWTLANVGNGKYCGVDNEMQILADTGCYADFTMPAAPEPMQITKINSIYESTLPFDRRAPHRRGRALKVGGAPTKYPILVQGPLMLDFGRGRAMPGIENGELSGSNPPTLHRLNLWRQAGVSVEGRPEWCFIKLHCHGMIPRDASAMVGRLKSDFLQQLTGLSKTSGEFQLHFVSAREMVNVILAACDGHSGNPGDFRDYRFRLFGSSSKVGIS
jgi:hypothetical protein